MELSCDPVIFYLGGLAVRWYLVFEIIALAAYITFFQLEARHKAIPLKHVYILFAVILVFGLIFGRVMDVAQSPRYYEASPQRFFSLGEQRINGVLAGGLVGTLLYCWIVRLSFWDISDARAAGIPLAIAIGRIGCFVNGCCHGIPCEFPFAVVYSSPHAFAPTGIALYPVQIFQSVWNFAVFAIIWLLRKRFTTAGLLYLLFLILYSGGDFIIRFLREDNQVVMNLQFAQIVDVLILFAALVMYINRRNMQRQIRRPML